MNGEKLIFIPFFLFAHPHSQFGNITKTIQHRLDWISVQHFVLSSDWVHYFLHVHFFFRAVSYFINLFWQIKCNLSLCSQHENLHICLKWKNFFCFVDPSEQKKKSLLTHLKRFVSDYIEMCKKNTIIKTYSISSCCVCWLGQICIGNFFREREKKNTILTKWCS